MLECKKCGETKGNDAFYKHPINATGYDYWCKACRKDYQVNLKQKPAKAPRTFNNTFKEIFGLD